MSREHRILGVDENADEKTIKRAYFKLIREVNAEENPERFEEIRQAYEALQNKDSNSTNMQFEVALPDCESARIIYEQIKDLENMEEYKKAIKKAEDAVAMYGEYSAFLFLIAQSALLSKAYGKAVTAYEKLCKMQPDNLCFGGELAIAYYKRGFKNKAMVQFEIIYDKGYREFKFVSIYASLILYTSPYDKSLELLEQMQINVDDNVLFQNIDTMFECYGAYFMRVNFADNYVDSFVKLCDLYIDFLDRLGRKIVNYEDMIKAVYFMTLQGMTSRSEYYDQIMGKINQIVDKVDKYLPGVLISDSDLDIEDEDVEKFNSDNRIGTLMKRTITRLLDLEKVDDGDADLDYIDYVMEDIMLSNLRAWPTQKADFLLMKKDYPMLFDRIEDLWNMINRFSKDDARYILEQSLPKYIRMSKKYEDSMFKELYPEELENADTDNVQWDSMDSGTYEREAPKIGRNDPCPCGSGKKYKKCCGK
jgi:tetratricopeptide (TPR) repeat protein